MCCDDTHTCTVRRYCIRVLHTHTGPCLEAFALTEVVDTNPNPLERLWIQTSSSGVFPRRSRLARRRLHEHQKLYFVKKVVSPFIGITPMYRLKNNRATGGVFMVRCLVRRSTATAHGRRLQSTDCSVCFDLTDAQEEQLANEAGGMKQIVCDLTCEDGITDPLHCNCKRRRSRICSYRNKI